MPKVEVWVNNLDLARLGELLATFDQEHRAWERPTDLNPEPGVAALHPLAPRMPTGSTSAGLGQVGIEMAQGEQLPPDVAVFVSDAGTIFDQEDVIQATLQLASEVSVAAATDLLKEFGVERARDIAGTDWEKYVTKAKARVTAHKAALDAQE